MRAVLVENPGPESVLYIGEIEKPVPRADELLVKVHTTALNRADLMQRSGSYPPPAGASPVMGLEMAGEVEAWGKNCSGWRKGDQVCGLLPGGGYAEYAVIPEKMAIPIPKMCSMVEAAAIPEVFLTAYQALYWLGQVEGGQRVLIHAGASGVGTAAIQMARESGAHVVVTASKAKHALCIELGASVAVDYKKDDFVQQIQEWTNQEGVDLVIDFIGAPYFSRNIDALKLDGRLVMLALMGGAVIKDPLHLGRLFRKRVRVQASTLRNRSEAYKIGLTLDFTSNTLPLIVNRTIKPVIDSIYEWTDVEEAHQRMAANKNSGKIVLKL